ncbi:MAG: metallophosphoesterase [Deltaproteobacteria bacterium]|nr:metallophosphoesterase [Deltaproteobacteria bacterium]
MGRLTLLVLLCVPVTASAQRIVKGPWALEVGESDARIRIETDTPTDFEVELEVIGGTAHHDLVFGGRTAAHADDAAVGTARLRELEPNTRYTYTVRAGSAEEHGELWTAPPRGEPFTFLVYGDDRTMHDDHRAVIERMLEETDARMLLHTGDYVEMGGRPADWETFFEIAGPLLRRAAIYPCLGNHELYGPGGLARYHRYLTRADTRETWFRQDYGDVVLLSLDSNVDWEPGVAQHDWLTATLAELDGERFVIAFVHHGPYSSGRHGGHEGMLAMGLPEQLRDGGVDLILSGHDHMYERGDAEGLKYVVTGGGGAPLYRVNDPVPYQLAFEPVHHYLRMRVEGGRLQMNVIRKDGSLLEECSFAKGEPWQCEGGGAQGPVGAGISREEDFIKLFLKRYSFYLLGIPVVIGVFVWWRRRLRGRTKKAE